MGAMASVLRDVTSATNLGYQLGKIIDVIRVPWNAGLQPDMAAGGIPLGSKIADWEGFRISSMQVR